MATQQEGQAAPQQQSHLVFSKWGVTVYREDLVKLITAARTHPLVAVGVAALAISIPILVLVLVGWLNLTPGVLTVLGFPVGIFTLLALPLVLEMQIKTALPILCVLAIVCMVRLSGSPENDVLATEECVAQQSVQQQQNLSMNDAYRETIAQSVCTSMAIKENRPGWTFAVKRQCNPSTEPCEAICSSAALRKQDNQTKSKQWSCLGAIHVYIESSPASGPSTASKPFIGFKAHWSSTHTSCQSGSCGPNYCCCFVAL